NLVRPGAGSLEFQFFLDRHRLHDPDRCAANEKKMDQNTKNQKLRIVMPFPETFKETRFLGGTRSY
ncbi:MAG: hypothetical protein WCH43_08860, partial [Verrucomicrobiota bacterium]